MEGLMPIYNLITFKTINYWLLLVFSVSIKRTDSSQLIVLFIYFILFVNFTGELVITRNDTYASIISSFNRPDNIKEICNNDKVNTQVYIRPVEYFNYWTTQLDDKFLEKYCEQNKHKI